MNSRLSVAVPLVILLSVLQADPSQAESARYSLDVVELSSYPFAKDAWLFDLNNAGQATGYIQQADTRVFDPVIFHANVFDVLPITRPSRFDSSLFYGWEINNKGMVVGTFVDDANSESPQYSAGFLTPDGPVSFPHVDNFMPGSMTGTRLNDDGQVVQLGFDASRARNVVMFYEGATARSLDFLEPLFDVAGASFDFGPLTNAGKFSVNLQSECDNVCSSTSILVDIPSATFLRFELPVGSESLHISSVAEDGSSLGMAYSLDTDSSLLPQVLGIWDVEGNLQASIPLIEGLRPGFIRRNNAGQVFAATTAGLFLYEGETWKNIAFDGYNASPPLMDLAQVNDAGQIVGSVYNAQASQFYAFVATPVPEPSAILIAALFIAPILAFRRCTLRLTTTASRSI